MLLRDSISFTFGADDWRRCHMQDRATTALDAQTESKNGGRFFQCQWTRREGAATLSARRRTEEDGVFAQRTFAASSRVWQSRRFSQDQSRSGSVEVRSDKTTRRDHLRPPKSRERMLLHSSICPFSSYPPPHYYIDMLNQFISYNRYPRNSVISSGPKVSNPYPGPGSMV